jgi:hypothetical protein
MVSLELLSEMWIMEKKSPLVTPRSEGVTKIILNLGSQVGTSSRL